MVWIIVIAIIVILLGIISLKGQKDNFKSKNRSFIYSVYYIGGFKDINGGQRLNIFFDKDNIELSKQTVKKVININEIEEVSIISQDYLQQQIGLGKMLVLGLISLALTNKKTVVKNYICISLKDGNNIILEPLDCEDFIKKYNEYFRTSN